MAGARQSVSKVQARTKARERAAEKAAAFAARETKLREFAERYFLVEVDVEDARAAAADRVKKVAQRAAAETVAINAEADQKVAGLEIGKAGAVDAMLTTGASVGEVAERLGLSAAAVRRLRTTAIDAGAAETNSSADSSSEATTGSADPEVADSTAPTEATEATDGPVDASGDAVASMVEVA